jgi:DNA-directed RNA polymerase sigma subunit (sigma70/sigma32)
LKRVAHERRRGPLHDRYIAQRPPEPPCPTLPLDAASELRLVRAARAGDEAARAKLLEAAAPLMRSLARAHGTARAGQRELMDAGAVGLLRALERYDTELGTPFWAYASWWVRQAMEQLAADDASA